MKSPDFAAIEQSLGVKLPDAYRSLMCGADAPRLADAGLFDDAALIVERTKEHREGYGGAPAWPTHLVYVGDQEDACPYVLDVHTGSIVQADHGDYSAKPLARFESVQKLAADLLATEEESNRPAWWAFWKQ
jgi:hypothetical protein